MQSPSYRILLMGVSGSGKSSIGLALAKKLDLAWIEGDDYHPVENKNKMAAGIPLTDEDREPWLTALAEVCAEKEEEGFVLACSALKQSYRQILVSKMRYKMEMFLLQGSQDLISKRMEDRKHFMPISLLRSQLDTLEISPDLVTISIEDKEDQIQWKIEQHLQRSDIAVIGLGVMGKSLARNFASRGIRVLAYNLPLPGEEEVTAHFIRDFGSSHLQGADSLESLIQGLNQPRKVLLMVKSGEPVDELLQALLPYLDKGDIVIDAGNSLFHDTMRRWKLLSNQELEFVGMGVSGGEEGALLGPSMMPAGSILAKGQLMPLLSISAANADQKACVSWIGQDGAGHFVKMVHNGIEYAEMQIIAEIFHAAKTCLPEPTNGWHDLFDTWNRGISASYLLEITAKILTKKDGEELLVEKILDVAGSKGTGLWTIQEALELGVALPTISSAVHERMISGEKLLRVELSKKTFPTQTNASMDRDGLQNLLLFARMVALAEGFHLIRKACPAFGWKISLAELAQIWRGGCIIRSELLITIKNCFTENPTLEHLFTSPLFGQLLQEQYSKSLPTYQQLCGLEISIPAISAAMNYYKSMHAAFLPTNLIQAQRDYFGAHTYQRLDGGDQFFHTKWEDK